MIGPTVILGAGFIGAAKKTASVPVVTEKKWMQNAKKSIERRGTKGICTGANKGRKGGPCPVGSRQYALANTFKKAAKAHSKKK